MCINKFVCMCVMDITSRVHAYILEQIQQQLADNSGFGLLVQVMATSKVTFSLSHLCTNKFIISFLCQQTIISCTHLRMTCSVHNFVCTEASKINMGVNFQYVISFSGLHFVMLMLIVFVC